MLDAFSFDPGTAKRAEWALINVIADLVEAALDHCSAGDAFRRLPQIIALSEDAVIVARALAVVARHGPEPPNAAG